MSDPNRPDRRLKFTLAVRDDNDDPSILDIVYRAVEDGLRTPFTETSPAPPETSEPVRHGTLNEQLEDQAREEVERALAKVIEEFEATGQEPKFAMTNWAPQLSQVWQVIREAKQKGIQLKVQADDGLPLPEET
jgi:hypothetical protein